MTTSNPNYNVGGTAKDGGISTAATVEDGGVDGGNRDAAGNEDYVPSEEGNGKGKSKTDSSSSSTSKATNNEKEDVGKKGTAHVGNPNYNVGGTAQDGGVSTADTVAGKYYLNLQCSVVVVGLR